MAGQITRRRALRVAGAAAAGVTGAALGALRAEAAGHQPSPTASPSPSPSGGWVPPPAPSFVSRPDLTPPPISVTLFGRVSPDRYIFLDSPNAGPGVGGGVIIDHTGELVWYGPDTAAGHKLDVNVQMLDGEPVLTWWEGTIVSGHGEGKGMIVDSSYRLKHAIYAKNGLKADLHEFFITPDGNAIISAFRLHSGVDLSALGGPKSGYVWSGVFQVIDIATGRLVFEWDSYDNPASPRVPVSETNLPLLRGWGAKTHPFDYFHINSICPDADGNYLVSSRHCWTVYKVSKTDGSIIWRLNGKNSDFSMGPGSRFLWQHHVRPYGKGRLTIFDNGSAGPTRRHEKQSRALILAVDETSKRATLIRATTHPYVSGRPVLASGLGDVQMLPGGEMFVGWGDARRFSQFGADGKMLLDGTAVRTASSYRVFSQRWTGRPAEPPAAAARYRSGGGATVYASWNGATVVASWTVFAGQPGRLSKVATARRTGFETAIGVSSSGPYFAVQAHDASGRALARSMPIRIS